MNILYGFLAGILVGGLGGFMIEKQVYDSYRGAVTAIGKQQERIAKDTGERHKRVVENLNEEYSKTISRNAADLESARLRLVQSRRDTRIVSAAASRSKRDLRVCYADRTQLEREISDALDRAAQSDLQDATQGDQALAVVSQCQEWAGRIGGR